MNTKFKAIFLFILISFFGLISQAQALELDQAKAQGLVGETVAGYIAAVKAPSAEVQQLINKVNAERKERYQKIAGKNQTPVAAVEALAGQKALELTQSGQYIQNQNGTV